MAFTAKDLKRTLGELKKSMASRRVVHQSGSEVWPGLCFYDPKRRQDRAGFRSDETPPVSEFELRYAIYERIKAARRKLSTTINHQAQSMGSAP